jgi:uncharacterized membrane protein
MLGKPTKGIGMTDADKSNDERQVLEALRTHRRAHRQAIPQSIATHIQQPELGLSLGQKISDAVAKTVGSWNFIVIQTIAILIWIAYNAWNRTEAWDPYPFILLNLMLSFQAAYTAPAIMMSQNRLSEIDRLQANNDFEINVKAELEIELLHQKIDMMKERELYALTKAVEALSLKLDRRG